MMIAYLMDTANSSRSNDDQYNWCIIIIGKYCDITLWNNIYIYIYLYIYMSFILIKIHSSDDTQKEQFAEVFKSLARYRPKNNFVDHQNNYVQDAQA